MRMCPLLKRCEGKPRPCRLGYVTRQRLHKDSAAGVRGAGAAAQKRTHKRGVYQDFGVHALTKGHRNGFRGISTRRQSARFRFDGKQLWNMSRLNTVTRGRAQRAAVKRVWDYVRKTYYTWFDGETIQPLPLWRDFLD